MDIDLCEVQNLAVDSTHFNERLSSPGVDVVSESFSGSCSLGKRKSGQREGNFELNNQRYFLDISKRGRSGSISYIQQTTKSRRALSKQYESVQCSSNIYLSYNSGGNDGRNGISFAHDEGARMDVQYGEVSRQKTERQGENRRRRREKASLFSKPWEAYPFKDYQRNGKNNLYKRQKLESMQ